jgi:hypothetical protein
VLRIEGALLVPRDEGADLDLVHRRHDRRVGQQGLEMGRFEVGDADRASAPVGIQLLERVPGRDELSTSRKRPVHQEQVDVVEPHPVERRLEPAQSPIVALELPVELRRDEQLAAVDAAAAHSLRDSGLVAVSGGRVEMPVADLRRGRHRIRRRGIVHRPGAETQLRNRPAGIEGDAGDLGALSHPIRLREPPSRGPGCRTGAR